MNLLERHFEQLVDFDFTARMEDDLDRIAAGDQERNEWLRRFYFGDGSDPGLHHLVTENLDEIDARAVNSIAIPGSDAVVRVGRYGPYLEHGERRASLPRRPRARRAVAGARGGAPLPARQQAARNGSRCRHRDRGALGPLRPVRDRGAPRGADEKPRTASLFSSMSPETSRSTTRSGCSRSHGSWASSTARR